MQTIIYTDGSSRGNPGPGGWGAIVISKDKVREIGGREEMTTNNKMELKGSIEALKLISSADEITLYSDSQYVIKGMTEWIEGWQRKGWKNSQKKPVLNRELWEELLEVSNGKNIVWRYVEGHSGSVGNERCDEIATKFADGEDVALYDGLRNKYLHKL